jgi:hypothetical protein
MELTLWFQKSPTCELLQARFARSTETARVSYRGKSLAFQRDAGLFQWSAAVKAFALLAVGTRLAASGGHREKFGVLEGERGSLAATLDYAIAKPTSWIVDLFGREASGKSYARIVFKRENSEQKRAGPVRVSLSSQLDSSEKLRIYLDGVEVTSTGQMTDLYELLQGDLSKKKPAASQTEVPIFRATWFQEILKKEVLLSLQETELLDRLGIDDACSRISPLFKSSPAFIATVLQSLLQYHELGQPAATRKKLNNSSKGEKNIQIACPPTAAGALALFHHLSISAKLRLEVHTSFPSARAILASPERSNFSALVLSWAAAKLFLKRREAAKFAPVMLLPRTSFALILRGELSSAKQIEKILLATEQDGYPMHFLRLAKQEKLLQDSIDPVQATFSEIMSLLPRKGDAAITAFPYSHLIAQRHRSKVLWNEEPTFRIGDNILFVKRSLLESALLPSLREAWFTLLENPSKLASALEQIYSRPDFINYLYRLAALYKTRVS